MSDFRIAAYLRVSTTDQNTDLQRMEIQSYLKARGWENVTFYEDLSSGTKDERRELLLLLKAVRQRKIDIVICWRLDRLFRSLRGLISTLQEFSDLGVQFISLRDNIDLTTSSGRLMAHIIGAFAEFEVSLIRDRVRAGLESARAKGKKLGRPLRRNDLQIAELRQSGLSIRSIGKKLNISPSSVQRGIAVSKTQKNPKGKS